MSEIQKASRDETKRILAHLSPEELLELEKEKLTDEERAARASDAELFYKSYFEKVLKLFTFNELTNMGKLAETTEQVLFYRGILYGFQTISDWFEDQVKISMSRFDKPEKPSEGAIPTVGKL